MLAKQGCKLGKLMDFRFGSVILQLFLVAAVNFGMFHSQLGFICSPDLRSTCKTVCFFSKTEILKYFLKVFIRTVAI